MGTAGDSLPDLGLFLDIDTSEDCDMTLNVGLSVPFLTSVVDGHLGPNLHLGILKPCSEQQRFSSSTSEVFPPKATHLASPHPTLCACLPFSTQHGPLSVSLSGSLFMLQVS